MNGVLRQFFEAVERTWLPVGDAVRQAARQALADLARVAAEARAAVRHVAAEVEAKVKPLLVKIEGEGCPHGSLGGRTRPIDEMRGTPSAHPITIARNVSPEMRRLLERENDASEMLAAAGRPIRAALTKTPGSRP